MAQQILLKNGPYELHEDGTFVVHNYHETKPYSGFLPGIAGVWGIPIWVYTVNRGQVVATFGLDGREQHILEFQSARLHQRRITLDGFRTFIKGRSNGKSFYYEPFRYRNEPYSVSNKLIQSFQDIRLEEVNETLGLSVTVHYIALPGEPFGALARKVTLTNRSEETIELELVDGFPAVVCYGYAYNSVKVSPFPSESFIQVHNLENRVPYYTLGIKPGDTSEVSTVQSGHYHFNFDFSSGEARQNPVIVESGVVFGDSVDLIRPYNFLESDPFRIPDRQVNECETPSAFGYATWKLEPGDCQSMYSYTGTARSAAKANAIPPVVMKAGYFEAKAEESRVELRKAQDTLFTAGGSRQMDLYTRQTWLDNVLRGGVPINIDAKDKKFTFHVYSRKHGDLERDYNFFKLSPTYFSQGNGNYRDVNQNRRNDDWINPAVGTDNIRTFFDLAQPDGFNPLLCKGAQFKVEDPNALSIGLRGLLKPDDRKALEGFLAEPFAPGELFLFVDDNDIEIQGQPQDLLAEVLSHCRKVADAEWMEGYWSDHWHYNFDLLESYLAIFPDKFVQSVFEEGDYTFRDTHIRVKPRDERYVLTPSGKVRHYRSLEEDAAKHRLIGRRKEEPWKVRTKGGHGQIYTTNLFGKILCIVVNRLATFSPSGWGIDMEGGRPGWCDTLNGMPGVFGAGLSESYRLRKVLQFLLDWIEPRRDQIADQVLPVELADFLEGVHGLLTACNASDDPDKDFAYWESANTIKEEYRARTHYGFDGAERTVDLSEILDMFRQGEKRLAGILREAVDEKTGVPISYVRHEAVDFEKLDTIDPDTGEKIPMLNEQGYRCVRVKKFERHNVAIYLQAPVHSLECARDVQEAKRLWDTIRRSPLFDKDLHLYRLNHNILEEPKEIGRATGRAEGWMETGSVFVHMMYKYLLETLRSGLHEEFFEDARKIFPPFRDIHQHGRSPLENGSFIASSYHSRENYRGRSMLPRLSGANAEYTHIILNMCFGKQPFRLEDGELRLCLAPILPEWMFTEEEKDFEFYPWEGTARRVTVPKNGFSALFLGTAMVTYHNPSRRSTYGENRVGPVSYRLIDAGGGEKGVDGHSLNSKEALDVREGRVPEIHVTLG